MALWVNSITMSQKLNQTDAEQEYVARRGAPPIDVKSKAELLPQLG